MIRSSHTVVLERNITWSNDFVSECYEGAWASEAVYFIRALEVDGDLDNAEARVQMSPDGIHWCDEGNVITLPTQKDEVTFVKVNHFGGWLRIVGSVPAEAEINVIVYLTLKA